MSYHMYIVCIRFKSALIIYCIYLCIWNTLCEYSSSKKLLDSNLESSTRVTRCSLTSKPMASQHVARY